MKTETQDLAWKFLPIAERNKIISVYACKEVSKSPYNEGYRDALRHLFGHNNLTSDEEPAELLFVNREAITNIYEANERIINGPQWPDNIKDKSIHVNSIFESLFGDKCLPDKEPSVQVEPKFKVGDKVRVKYPKLCKGKIGIIDEIGSRIIEYHLQGDEIFENSWFGEDMLEPYTEPETKDNNNMEEKELNLCELLKDFEYTDTSFYSSLFGESLIREINSYGIDIAPVSNPTERVTLWGNGNFGKNGQCILFPSRALYEKYPLDAAKAWRIWAEERKPKHILQAHIRLISKDGKTVDGYEEVELEVSDMDLTQAAEAVMRTLEEFHKNHTEQ